MCFRNMVDFLINETWHAQRKESVAEESLRIVTAAAKIIQAEIRDSKYNMEYYPANEDIKMLNVEKNGFQNHLQPFAGARTFSD